MANISESNKKQIVLHNPSFARDKQRKDANKSENQVDVAQAVDEDFFVGIQWRKFGGRNRKMFSGEFERVPECLCATPETVGRMVRSMEIRWKKTAISESACSQDRVREYRRFLSALKHSQASWSQRGTEMMQELTSRLAPHSRKQSPARAGEGSPEPS